MEFIINKKRVVVNLDFFAFERALGETTAFSEGVRTYLPGNQFLDLEGRTNTGEILNERFHCVGKTEEGIYIIKTLDA